METILFLEGSKVLSHVNYVKENLDVTVTDLEFNTIVLDGLYVDYYKLIAVKYIKPEYIHIRTTGVVKDKLNILIDVLKHLTTYLKT